MSPSNGKELTADEGIDLPFDPETDLFWFYVVEAEVKGCSAEFYLNDIALSLNTPDEGYFFAQPANQLVVDGENHLSFIVKPGPRPSEALIGADGEKTEAEAYDVGLESVTVKLCRYPFGSVVGGPDCQVLHTLRWPQEIHEETHEYPLQMSVRFPLKTGTGAWQWQSLEPVKLDDPTRESIAAFLSEIHASLEGKNPDLFLEAAAPRFNELAAAYEDPPYKKRNAFRRMVDEINGMQPLDPASFDLRLAAGGRLVECLQKDWSPILRGSADAEGNEDHYDMFIGRLDGHWKIFR